MWILHPVVVSKAEVKKDGEKLLRSRSTCTLNLVVFLHFLLESNDRKSVLSQSKNGKSCQQEYYGDLNCNFLKPEIDEKLTAVLLLTNLKSP